MAYTIRDEYGYCLPIRLIADHQPSGANWFMFQICDPLPRETKWECDPCAPSIRRYRIQYPSGAVQEFPWFQVILWSDTEADIAVKTEHFARVKQARIDCDEAIARMKRLCGEV